MSSRYVSETQKDNVVLTAHTHTVLVYSQSVHTYPPRYPLSLKPLMSVSPSDS